MGGGVGTGGDCAERYIGWHKLVNGPKYRGQFRPEQFGKLGKQREAGRRLLPGRSDLVVHFPAALSNSAFLSVAVCLDCCF
jgi:hypothetical protein